MKYWYQLCPVCEQGRLFVRKAVGASRLFLLCEECESAWSLPGEVDRNTGNFAFEGNNLVFADGDAIKESGWTNVKLHEAQ